MVRGVQAVKARAVPDTTFFCLSNSNSVFIDVILKVRTSSDNRPEVTATDWVGHSTTRSNLNLSRSSPTPPSSSRMACCRSSDAWTPPGRSTAAGLAAAPTCARASDPLCSVLEADRRASSTGKELDEFMERHGGWATFDRVVYVGDGGNDFCPLLRLRPCVLSPLTELKLIRAQTRPCVGAVVPRALATDHQGGRVGGAQGVRPVLGRRVGGRADPPVERVAAVAWSCLPKSSNPTLVDSPRCNCSCRAARLSCIAVREERAKHARLQVGKLEFQMPPRSFALALYHVVQQRAARGAVCGVRLALPARAIRRGGVGLDDRILLERHASRNQGQEGTSYEDCRGLVSPLGILPQFPLPISNSSSPSPPHVP